MRQCARTGNHLPFIFNLHANLGIMFKENCHALGIGRLMKGPTEVSEVKACDGLVEAFEVLAEVLESRA